MLRVHNDAVADLREIRKVDGTAFARLVALIEQLKADPDLKNKLLEHNLDDVGISVMKWIGLWKKNIPVWRCKGWDLEDEGLKYRLIYCFNPPDQTFNILAIVPRANFDYDDANHPIRKRVVARMRSDFPRA